jgi:hypothetical protein
VFCIGTPSRSRGLISPSFARTSFPPTSEGAGNAGCTLHPRSRVQVTRKCAHEHTGSAEAIRHSLRNGFTVSFVLSPAIGLFCHRRLADTSARLERQRRGVRTTRLRRPPQALSSEAPSASTASRPAFVTIASRPSVGRDGENCKSDLPKRRTEIFLQMRLDSAPKSPN